MEEITIVILTKNEEGNIDWVIEELKSVNLLNIIVVDAGSTDRTIDILEKKKVNYFTQTEKGYGAAIIEGIEKVKTKYFSIIDADGSYDTRDIPLMLQKLKNENLDFVMGSRYLGNNKSDDDTIIRYIGNKFFTKLCQVIFNLNITDILFHFPVGTTDLYKKLDLKYKDFSICVEVPILINHKKYKYKEYFSKERPRMTGESKVNAAIDGIKILFKIFKLISRVR